MIFKKNMEAIKTADILLVDDEKEIRDLLEVYFKNESYNVFSVQNAAEALEVIDNNTVDIAIIDIMMSDLDGFSLCRKIREKYLFPIIMLTAKIEDSDKIFGLAVGADDYITKPFNPLEVVARTKTQLRRYLTYNTNREKQNREIEVRGLSLNLDSRKCFLFDEEIFLTPLEFNILALLCENKGRVLSSEEIFEKVWNEKYFESNNTVMTHIGRLREKLREPSKNPRFIKTVWGVGYRVD